MTARQRTVACLTRLLTGEQGGFLRGEPLPLPLRRARTGTPTAWR